MATKGGCIDFMFLGPPLPGRWIRYCSPYPLQLVPLNCRTACTALLVDLKPFQYYSKIPYLVIPESLGLTLRYLAETGEGIQSTAKSTDSFRKCTDENNKILECIPVGCVPSAAVAACPPEVCLSACWDTNSPRTRYPQSRHPPTRHPLGPGTLPVDRHTPVKT